MDLARQETGLDDDELAVVARLLVAPHARSRGIASAMLGIAAFEARHRGRLPVLDVDVTLTNAIGLYERTGWHKIGTVDLLFPDGRSMPEHVYAGPE